MGGYKKNSRRRQPRGPRSSSHHTVEHHQLPPPRPLEINEETRWKAKVFVQHQPQEGQATAADDDDDDDARLLLLLNKLSPTNFERHVTRFASTTTLHRSEGRTRRAVDAVVSRAALDARYTAMYAALCVRLASELKPEAKAEEESTTAAETLPPSPSEKVDDGGAAAADSSVTSSPPSPSFGTVLVEHCRKELSVDPTLLLDDENDGNNEDSRGGELEHPEEREARISIARKRYVGTARFVGELYNCRNRDGGDAAAAVTAVGTEDLLRFVDALFREALPMTTTTTPGAAVQELPLEGLCALLVTCGKKMEGEAASDERPETLWDDLERLVRRGTAEDGRDRPPLSFRMKFMVADLLDLRSSGWVPSGHIAKHRKELVAKTLQEIHDEWEGCGGPCQPQRRRGNKKKSGKKVRFGRS